MATASLLRQQLDYYRARAPEYDEWWLRQGRYNRGETENAAWFRDTRRLERKLEEFHPAGHVLELACGTGLWTVKLAETADVLTAVDGSTEMLALNAGRCAGHAGKIEYRQADLFTWKPEAKYDTVFFAFWLSHVPLEKFRDFWSMVQECLTPGGRVLFFDSLHTPSSTAADHHLPPPEETTLERRLNDGRTFTICKIFHEPERLREALREMGWESTVARAGEHFLAGECHVATRRPSRR